MYGKDTVMSVQQMIRTQAVNPAGRLAIPGRGQLTAAGRRALAWAYIKTGSLVATFAAAGATILWAYLSVPNTPP